MATPGARPSLVAVAYSGGRDSTALLHAVACAAREHAGMLVFALHVHHGLSAHADAWLLHARETCQRLVDQGLPVRFVSRHVQVSQSAGASLEAEARRARYRALADMAREAGVELVMLAHHRQDQAETFLLQALRGAGLNGLASMPAQIERDGVRWVRPWLGQPRNAIEAYAAHHGLSWVDDDSNSQTRFARNRLRLDVWPELLRAFPQAEATLAASAKRLQDVLPAVESWRADLVGSLLVSKVERCGSRLNASLWCELSGAERRETLLCWYRQVSGANLGASWVKRLAHEVPSLIYRQKALIWHEIGLGLYRGELFFAGFDVSRGRGEPSLVESVAVRVLAPGDHDLAGWSGLLRVSEVDSGGVLPGLLANAVARPRSGGEQFQAGVGRPVRSLKKQFQSLGVPSWCRDGPLIWSGDALVFVPGLGVDARSVAPDGVTQWGLEWVAAPR